MAYGLRLRIEYKDINDILTRINIYQDGYTGNADIRFANAGFKADWGDQGGEGMPVIYGSSCTLYFDAEFDYEFLYLFTSDAKKYKVEISKDPNGLYWLGYIEPDSWGEPLIAAPYPVQCTAYDGLGFLDNVPFLDAEGLAYTGKKTIFEILKICLLKTGLDLNINMAVDWEEENQTPGSDYSKVHKLNCDNFLDLSCYEVLEAMFPECRVFQRNGEWWIVSNTNFYRESIAYFTTFPDDQDIEVSYIECVASNWWFEDQQIMEILPALKHLTAIQDFGVVENLIINGSFEKFNNGQFDGWIANGVDPHQLALNKDGDKYVYFSGKYWPDEPITHDTIILPNRYIRKSLEVKQSASIFKLSLYYGLVGVLKQACEMFITCKLIGSTNTYYLRYKPTELDTEGFEWWIDDALNYFRIDNGIRQPSSLGFIPLRAHNAKNIDGYYKTADNITAYPFDQLVDHFESFNAAVSGIPEDGTIELSLYVPYTNKYDIYGAAFTGIKLELLNDDEERYPATTAYKVTNSERNNYVPEDAELIVGDYPDIANSDIMFRGGISRIDDTHTTGWRQTGTTEYHTFSELVALMRAAYQRSPRQAYQVRVADMIPRLNMVIIDENNGGIRLFENGISYDDRMQAVDGRYVELAAFNYTGLIVETATEFDSKTGTATGKSTTKVVNAKPVNIEERVTLIDKQGAIVSKASTLLDNDFESKTYDPDDGLGRIQIKKRGVRPYALDLDAALVPFSIQDALVETNVDDIANKVMIEAGTITLHQVNALDKDDRQDVIDAGEVVYDPSVIISIPETIATIPDNARRSVYLKIALTELES